MSNPNSSPNHSNPEHLFPDFELPDDIDEAIGILEADLSNNIAYLRENVPTVADPISAQIAYTIAAGRVKADSEVLTLLDDTRKSGGEIPIQEV